MICECVFEEVGKAGTRRVVLGCSGPVEQSSVQVQYKEEALWRGQEGGNGTSVTMIGRCGHRSW